MGKENHNYGRCHLLEARKNTKTAFSTAHHGCICQVGSFPVLFSIWIQAGDTSGKLPGKHRPCPSLPALPSSVACSRPPPRTGDSRDRFLPVHCSNLGYSLKKDKQLPGITELQQESMRIIGMKQIWISSGAEIKDVTVTERGLLLLLSVIQISHADFSTSHLLISE